MGATATACARTPVDAHPSLDKPPLPPGDFYPPDDLYPPATASQRHDPQALSAEVRPLPPPRLDGSMSLEETLAARRSVRDYANKLLTWEEIGQLLWSMQGLTREWGGRTAPSAGALYPLETYVATAEGLHHYEPAEHQVTASPQLGLRQALWEVSLKQDWIRLAPAVFIITAVYERTLSKYGQRAARYVHMEAGHAAENLLLQAVALGLGGVVVGAFYDDRVRTALNLPQDHEPLYLIPVGHPRST
ncbi:MAG: SagB/ThcOx family dehydrogenase [Anaerolineae bacterium]|nr:SagB/ThcOx family dehydrogenase [Anaerolineae bacterium]